MRKRKGNVAYTILVICEGENTEPSFFNSIADKIKDGFYQLSGIENNYVNIVIRPEPKQETEETENEASIHKPKRNNRKIKKIDGVEIEENVPLPLKYVDEGQKELQENTFNEVWAVFDHDNHPARKEAFEKAEELINGKKVNIAFSSVSFEYYLLLHFEKINKEFLKSQCRGGRKENREIYNCGTGKHPVDCYGEKCVGGYARTKDYWQKSKDRKIPIFPLIEQRLKIGFINSAWLRHISDKENKKIEIYDRNPYITTDTLVKRLTGNDSYEYEWVDIGQKYTIDDLAIASFDSKIQIENTSNSRSIIIPTLSFCYLDDTDNQKDCCGSRLNLEPKQIELIKLPDVEKLTNKTFLFTYEKKRIIFSI